MKLPDRLLLVLGLWLLAVALPAALPAQTAGRAALTAEHLHGEVLMLGGELRFHPGGDPFTRSAHGHD